MTQAASKTKSQNVSSIRILEEAREAVTKLRALKPLLSPQDEETLAILMDKKLVSHLEKSLHEVQAGKTEPLKNILK